MSVYQSLCLLSLAMCVFAAKETKSNSTVTHEVTFEVQIGEADAASRKGKFTIGLFGEACPVTSLNFMLLSKGFKHGDQKWQFKNTKIFRIIPDFLIQMGDVLYGDGRGGRSVFNSHFIDENFIFSHKSAGMVAMANEGVDDSNGSQFYITLNKVRWLDGKNVVFGKVVKGMNFVNYIGQRKVLPNTAVPATPIKITSVKVETLDTPYELTKADLLSNDDIIPGAEGEWDEEDDQ